MSLSKKQRRFTKCLRSLLEYAESKGYEFTLGDAYRDPRVFGEFGVILTNIQISRVVTVADIDAIDKQI